MIIFVTIMAVLAIFAIICLSIGCIYAAYVAWQEGKSANARFVCRVTGEAWERAMRAKQ